MTAVVHQNVCFFYNLLLKQIYIRHMSMQLVANALTISHTRKYELQCMNVEEVEPIKK